MKAIIKLLFFSLLLPILCFSQSKNYNNKQDSINAKFSDNNIDAIEAFIHENPTNNIEESNLYFLTLAKCALKKKQIESIPDLLVQMSFNAQKDSLQYYFLARKDEILGHYYYYKNNLDQCTNLLLNSKRFYLLSNNYESAIYNHIILGIIYRKKNNYVEALQQYFAGVSLYNKPGLDSNNYVLALNDISIIYFHLEDYSKSLDILDQLMVKQNIISEPIQADIYNNYALNYRAINKDSLAYNYLLKAEKLYLKLNNKSKLSIIYNNLATFQKDLLNNQNKSLSYYKKSILLKKELRDNLGLTQSFLNLSKIYLQQNNYYKALPYGDSALTIANELQNNFHQKEAHLVLASLNAKLSNFKKAYQHQLQYNQLQDSVWNIEKERALHELEKRFEIQKIENELALTKKENELRAVRITTNKRIIIILILASILLFSFLILYIVTLGKKAKAKHSLYKKSISLASLSSLVKGQEEERKRIARDLHDDVGNSLTLLILTLQKNNQQQLLKLAQSISKDVRSISYNLMPNGISKLGLKTALQDLCKSWSSTDIIVDLNFKINNALYTDKLAALTLYRIVQEIIKNAIVNGKSTYITVLLKLENNSIVIYIEDNGIGFDTEIKHAGLGLKNIENRVTYLNGTLILNSQKGSTSYKITLPKSFSTNPS